MSSHVALNLVNGMLKLTITKNELLTLFKLFDFGHLYLNGVCRTDIRHDVLLINSDVTGTLEMVHRSVGFDVRLTEYHVM